MNELLILTKKHKTFKERVENFENLSDKEKGNIEFYDWGDDLGAEIFQ